MGNSRLTKLPMLRSQPIIFVTGCTGTGKSDLGIAIAQKYGGEVISADSMQIYRGLDIVTNKVTAEETCGVPHHLMSFLDPAVDGYNVQQFQRSALKIIEEIRERGNIPILVGGTAYYIESVLFDDYLLQTPENNAFSEYNEFTNEQLYNLLTERDPACAALIHPNNRARVLRALDILKLTGKSKSDLIKEQHMRNGAQGRPRFEENLVLITDADKEILDNRLNSRVEVMIRSGLKNELEDFYIEHEETIGNITHGVLQCIGPKEFLPYLKSKENWNTKRGERTFKKSCDDLQLHTRQYARKQGRWIKSRFYRKPLGDQITVVTVDSSVKETFITNGLELCDKWMTKNIVRTQLGSALQNNVEANMIYRCDDCNRVISGKSSWELHLKGKPHRKLVAAKKAKESLEQKTLIK